MSRLAELKPCPFCGGADVELREDNRSACVACNNCGSRTGVVFLGIDDASNANKRREVVAAWNTRTADAKEPLRPNSVGESETADTAINAEPGGDVLAIIATWLGDQVYGEGNAPAIYRADLLKRASTFPFSALKPTKLTDAELLAAARKLMNLLLPSGRKGNG